MRYILSIVFILASFFSSLAQNNVLYGERNLEGNKLAIYYDREGTIYPDYFIADASLERSCSSLKMWYTANTEQFLEVARQYGCHFAEYSVGNIKILNDSIVAVNCRKINLQKGNFNSATFLVHGFRKPFVASNGDYTSGRDFAIMEKNISDLGKRNECFVEVYWDALYGCCFTANVMENEKLFHLFDQAQTAAKMVGASFRDVLSRTTFDTINLYSHSLGAQVIAQTLFNVVECAYPTPLNARVNICMIAPAISGIETFKSYYNRNTDFDYRSNDNYRLAIVYNDNDFVLLKRDNKVGWFGPGPYGHGNTSLGCNYHHTATKLEAYFLTEYRQSSIRTFDLSLVGKCHHVRCYCAGANLLEAIRYIMM